MLAAALPAGGEPLAMKEQSGLRWVCGGVGSDERRELAALAARANLEVLFVSARRGSYLAGVRLAIEPVGKGGAGRSEIVSEGPTCLIDLPPGSYRLRARLGDVERSTTVRVDPVGRSPSRAVLTFPDEPWDGIRASEEEKRQARE